MNEFERQIQQRRSELDRVEDVPVPKLWTGIEEQMAGQKSGARERKYQRWLLAASVLVVVSLGIAFFGQQSSVPAPMVMSDLSPELAKQEAAFLRTIAQKEAALKLNELDRAAYAPFFEEISLLDSFKTESQKELPNYGANDRLLSTIIRYYELKILLLEQLENDLAKQQYYGTPYQALEI
ncbi:hypothetical protein [Neolewinella persica]|uniref:hypothetical protein n=1 Tax=Neolewinella persica TaxID=70998 RepID=UPI0003668A2B|nr:hypothetical protein [Neolewinella persica]